MQLQFCKLQGKEEEVGRDMNIKALQEVAEMWGVSEATLRAAAGAGRLSATKSGKVWLVNLDDKVVQEYRTGLVRKPRGEKPTCEVCGKPLMRVRSKFCSRQCMGQAMKPTQV